MIIGQGTHGCVILAPHFDTLHEKRNWGYRITIKRLSVSGETRCAGRIQNERYNNGSALKITCRTEAGVIVTIIADNYYGYCKKEVKTQISYAANLLGNAEEEHAGGTLAFIAHHLGEEFQWNSRRYNGRTFEDLVRDYSSFIDIQPEGYELIERNQI